MGGGHLSTSYHRRDAWHHRNMKQEHRHRITLEHVLKKRFERSVVSARTFPRTPFFKGLETFVLSFHTRTPSIPTETLPKKLQLLTSISRKTHTPSKSISVSSASYPNTSATGRIEARCSATLMTVVTMTWCSRSRVMKRWSSCRWWFSIAAPPPSGLLPFGSLLLVAATWIEAEVTNATIFFSNSR